MFNSFFFNSPCQHIYTEVFSHGMIVVTAGGVKWAVTERTKRTFHETYTKSYLEIGHFKGAPPGSSTGDRSPPLPSKQDRGSAHRRRIYKCTKLVDAEAKYLDFMNYFRNCLGHSRAAGNCSLGHKGGPLPHGDVK